MLRALTRPSQTDDAIEADYADRRKNMSCKHWTVPAVFSLMALCAVGHAGVVETAEDGTVNIFSEGNFRSIGPDGEHIIFDTATGTVSFLDTQRRIYSSGSAEEYCKVMQAIAKQMAAHIGDVGELHDKAQAKVSIKEAGDGGTIAGYRTTRYRVMADGELYEELWLSADPALAVELRKAHRSPWRSLNKCVEQAFAFAGPSVEDSPEYQRLADKGWSLKWLYYQDGEAMDGGRIVDLKIRRIPAAEFRFTPPAGFRRVGLAEFHGGAAAQ